jgi:plasmid segregation protein ParM
MTSLSKVSSADVGYGYTKAIGPGGEMVIFPSIVGPAIEIAYKADMIPNGRDMVVEFDGRRYFIGEWARLQSPDPVTPQNRDRSLEIVRLLALTALAQVTGGRCDRLVTGLPVAWYRSDRSDIEEALTGEHTLTLNGVESSIAIARTTVVPQPAGGFFGSIISHDGTLTDSHKLARAKVAILDIGMHTTDCVLMDNMTYIDHRSDSIEAAAGEYYALLRREIRDRYKVNLTLRDIEQITQNGNTMTLWGNKVVVDQDIIAHSRAHIAARVIEFARDLWPHDVAKTFDTILVVGGGAALFFDDIRQAFPSAHLAPNPQQANVDGFQRYGLFKESHK